MWRSEGGGGLKESRRLRREGLYVRTENPSQDRDNRRNNTRKQVRQWFKTEKGVDEKE